MDVLSVYIVPPSGLEPLRVAYPVGLGLGLLMEMRGPKNHFVPQRGYCIYG